MAEKKHQLGCYWYSQGKCQLYTMPEEMLFSILTRVPAARDSIVECGLKCPEVDDVFIKFASNPDTMVKDQTIANQELMDKINRYNDAQRLAEANPTTPKDPDAEDE
jgi:hypothetical protein